MNLTTLVDKSCCAYPNIFWLLQVANGM